MKPKTQSKALKRTQWKQSAFERSSFRCAIGDDDDDDDDFPTRRPQATSPGERVRIGTNKQCTGTRNDLPKS
jgi:hypothetical protein